MSLRSYELELYCIIFLNMWYHTLLWSLSPYVTLYHFFSLTLSPINIVCIGAWTPLPETGIFHSPLKISHPRYSKFGSTPSQGYFPWLMKFFQGGNFSKRKTDFFALQNEVLKRERGQMISYILKKMFGIKLAIPSLGDLVKYQRFEFPLKYSPSCL